MSKQKLVMIGFIPGKKTKKKSYSKFIVKLKEKEYPYKLPFSLKHAFETGIIKESE